MTAAIIFDMDGTLFQTNLILEPALEATFEQLRAMGAWYGATPIDLYRNIMGVPLDIVWQTLCPTHSVTMRQQSNTLFQQALIKQIKGGHGALYDGVMETLATLAKDYPIYIASNGQSAYLQAIVDCYEMDRYVKAVYSIDRIPTGEKYKLVALLAAEQTVTEAVVVGDRASDIEAAHQNNFHSIGVRFDFAQEAELQLAHTIVDTFPQILEALSKNR